MSGPSIPPPAHMLWPALEAVREHGDSVTIEGHDEAVAQKLALTDEQLNELHNDGPGSLLEGPVSSETGPSGCWGPDRHRAGDRPERGVSPGRAPSGHRPPTGSPPLQTSATVPCKSSSDRWV
jgi:hypothetical protein